MREPPETTAPSHRTRHDRGRSFPHVVRRDGVGLDPCNVNDRVLPATFCHADVSELFLLTLSECNGARISGFGLLMQEVDDRLWDRLVYAASLSSTGFLSIGSVAGLSLA